MGGDITVASAYGPGLDLHGPAAGRGPRAGDRGGRRERRAAVHRDHRAGDHRGVVRDHEQHGPRDVLRVWSRPSGVRASAALVILRVVDAGGGVVGAVGIVEADERRVHVARRDDQAAENIRCVRERRRAGQAHQPHLGRAVARAAAARPDRGQRAQVDDRPAARHERHLAAQLHPDPSYPASLAGLDSRPVGL